MYKDLGESLHQFLVLTLLLKCKMQGVKDVDIKKLPMTSNSIAHTFCDFIEIFPAWILNFNKNQISITILFSTGSLRRHGTESHPQASHFNVLSLNPDGRKNCSTCEFVPGLLVWKLSVACRVLVVPTMCFHTGSFLTYLHSKRLIWYTVDMLSSP